MIGCHFLSFVPPLMVGGCFPVYCLGLQEVLVNEQELEGGEELEKFRNIRFMTLIFFCFYIVSYTGVYILNIVVLEETSIGKDIFFGHRLMNCRTQWHSSYVDY